MKLLSVEKTREDKNRAEQERAERIRKLNAEETASARRLSLALDAERTEKSRLEEDMELVRNESELLVKKSVLLGEVKFLEKRKSDAMKPIAHLEKEWHEKLAEVETTIESLKKRSSALAMQEKSTEEIKNTLGRMEEEAQKKSVEISTKLVATDAAQSEIQRLKNHLAQEWVDFHKATALADDSLSQREHAIAAREKALDTRLESLKSFEYELKESERGLQDRYATLEQSVEEFRNKQK